jgi:hypothetical protein
MLPRETFRRKPDGGRLLDRDLGNVVIGVADRYSGAEQMPSPSLSFVALVGP